MEGSAEILAFGSETTRVRRLMFTESVYRGGGENDLNRAAEL